MDFVVNLIGTKVNKIGSCGPSILSAMKSGPYTSIIGDYPSDGKLCNTGAILNNDINGSYNILA